MAAEDTFSTLSQSLGLTTEELVILVVIILVWKLIWYGLAIYNSLEKKQKRWFVVLFIVAVAPINDLGLLAIAYLLINKKPLKPKPKQKKKKK